MFQISLAGKGSSGKSTLVPFLIERLAPNGRLLVVDADPHQSAARLLGITPLATLGSLRSQYERQFKSGSDLPPDETREAFAESVMGEQALVHCPGYDFLPMGHWEPGGSQCTVNRVLSRALARLTERYAQVLVDNEAGIEHIGRFDLPIDLLLLIATPDPLFLDVAARIWQRIQEVRRSVRQARLVINRTLPEDPADLRIPANLSHLPITFLPESPALRRLSRLGHSPLTLPGDDAWRVAVGLVMGEEEREGISDKAPHSLFAFRPTP